MQVRPSVLHVLHVLQVLYTLHTNLSPHSLPPLAPCSVADGKIYVRGYSLGFFKSGTKVPEVELQPMGPFFDLTLRRSQVRAPCSCAVCFALCPTRCAPLHFSSQSLSCPPPPLLRPFAAPVGGLVEGGYQEAPQD